MKNQFNELGYIHLKNFFTKEEILRAENALISLFAMQVGKIGEYSEEVKKIITSDSNNLDKMSAIYDLAEEKDKESLYQAQFFIYENLSVKILYAKPEFESICKELLGIDKEILVNGPGLFVNKPNTQRLLYKWHSESHYYPKRLNFLNVWLPIFTNKVEDNGTMSLKLKSHLKPEFPFSEYRGYDKDTENKANHFIQYEIPDNFVKDFEDYQTVSEVGDLVIFHRKLVHRSNNNPSDKHSYALVSRIWEPSHDLTISGRIEVTPYKGGDGRANLIVNPL